jgi:hypothetical protein
LQLLLSFDDSYQTWQGAIGSKGIGAGLNDITFLDKLSTDLYAYYMKGTNHKDNVNLFTTDDSYYEMNVNNDYKLYENLSLILEMGYGKVSFDEKKLDNDHLYRAVGGLVYKFEQIIVIKKGELINSPFFMLKFWLLILYL